MFMNEKKMASLAPVYNQKRHMSVGGGLSGELAEFVQNFAPVVCHCNCIAISVSQVYL